MNTGEFRRFRLRKAVFEATKLEENANYELRGKTSKRQDTEPWETADWGFRYVEHGPAESVTDPARATKAPRRVLDFTPRLSSNGGSAYATLAGWQGRKQHAQEEGAATTTRAVSP